MGNDVYNGREGNHDGQLTYGNAARVEIQVFSGIRAREGGPHDLTEGIRRPKPARVVHVNHGENKGQDLTIPSSGCSRHVESFGAVLSHLS